MPVPYGLPLPTFVLPTCPTLPAPYRTLRHFWPPRPTVAIDTHIRAPAAFLDDGFTAYCITHYHATHAATPHHAHCARAFTTCLPLPPAAAACLRYAVATHYLPFTATDHTFIRHYRTRVRHNDALPPGILPRFVWRRATEQFFPTYRGLLTPLDGRWLAAGRLRIAHAGATVALRAEHGVRATLTRLPARYPLPPTAAPTYLDAGSGQPQLLMVVGLTAYWILLPCSGPRCSLVSLGWFHPHLYNGDDPIAVHVPEHT